MILKALRILNASKNNSMSCETDTSLTRSRARLRKPLLSSRYIELSRPNFVEACDMGVVGGDDIALHLPCANAHAYVDCGVKFGQQWHGAKDKNKKVKATCGTSQVPWNTWQSCQANRAEADGWESRRGTCPTSPTRRPPTKWPRRRGLVVYSPIGA